LGIKLFATNKGIRDSIIYDASNNYPDDVFVLHIFYDLHFEDYSHIRCNVSVIPAMKLKSYLISRRAKLLAAEPGNRIASVPASAAYRDLRAFCTGQDPENCRACPVSGIGLRKRYTGQTIFVDDGLTPARG
jgi:hypothetical protein